MKNLSTSHPSAQILLKEERFAISLTGKPYSKTPMDQVIGTTFVHQKKQWFNWENRKSWDLCQMDKN